jgi:hypothetical protein
MSKLIPELEITYSQHKNPMTIEPEPNWRSLYEALKKEYDELEVKYDALLSDWLECGSGS